MSTTDTREAFEYWFSDEGAHPRAIERSNNGGYILAAASQAWNVWQAATEAAKATGTAPLPKWIDDQKGKDPLIDDLIHYIETLQACAARQPAPVADNDAFKEAYMEWSRKTDWVQEQISSFPPSALGKHRADVMREEIERLRAALAATAAPVLPRDLRIEIGRVLTDLGECAVIGARMTIGEDRVKELKTIMQTILSATRSQP